MLVDDGFLEVFSATFKALYNPAPKSCSDPYLSYTC